MQIAGRTKEGGLETPEGAGGCGARAAAGAASVCAFWVLRSRPWAGGAPWLARGARRAAVRRAHGARTRTGPVTRRRRRGRRLRLDACARSAPASVGGGPRGVGPGAVAHSLFPHPRSVAGRWRGSLAVPRPLEIEPGCCLHDGSGGRSLRGGGERKSGVPVAAVAGQGAGESRAVPEARTRELRVGRRGLGLREGCHSGLCGSLPVTQTPGGREKENGERLGEPLFPLTFGNAPPLIPTLSRFSLDSPVYFHRSGLWVFVCLFVLNVGQRVWADYYYY